MDYPYVFLDATYCKARIGHRVVSQAVMVAYGVAADGRREVLGFDVGDSENEGFSDRVPAVAEDPWTGQCEACDLRRPQWLEEGIITEVAGKEFQTAGHLASYAGLAPVTWRSGTSIRGDHPSKKGNKSLKRAFFLSAFAALKDPLSRAYYDRKRAEGKRHNQARIALTRRRCDVLFAMLRDGALYDAPTTTTT